MTHKTKGIILRTIKYGETSLVATVYTELFGLQTYMLKGVRKATKKSSPKSNYFQPGAILAMEVYHNELKNIQFIKEYEWAHLFHRIFFDVVRNAVAMYIAELLLQCIKQPEPNPDIFFLVENSLLFTDNANDTAAANMPLYFTLQLALLSGFRLLGTYNTRTPVLDLREGIFITAVPAHNDYLKEEEASVTSLIYTTENFDGLQETMLNKTMRRNLLNAYLLYLSFHIQDMGEIKTLMVLQQVL